MKKPKIVIFEGPDKVGKTTLLNKYRKATDYQVYTIDRFFASGGVYDLLFGRKNKCWCEYLQEEQECLATFNPFLVVVVCSSMAALYERIIAGEKDDTEKTIALSFMETAHFAFKSWYKESKIENKLLLDTANRTVVDCLDELLKFTNV